MLYCYWYSSAWNFLWAIWDCFVQKWQNFYDFLVEFLINFETKICHIFFENRIIKYFQQFHRWTHPTYKIFILFPSQHAGINKYVTVKHRKKKSSNASDIIFFINQQCRWMLCLCRFFSFSFLTAPYALHHQHKNIKKDALTKYSKKMRTDNRTTIFFLEEQQNTQNTFLIPS